MMKVNLSIGDVEVRNSPTAPTFNIKSDGAQFGELVVCKGGMYWRKRYGRSFTKISWHDFRQFADEYEKSYPQAQAKELSDFEDESFAAFIPDSKKASFFSRLFNRNGK